MRHRFRVLFHIIHTALLGGPLSVKIFKITFNRTPFPIVFGQHWFMSVAYGYKFNSTVYPTFPFSHLRQRHAREQHSPKRFFLSFLNSNSNEKKTNNQWAWLPWRPSRYSRATQLQIVINLCGINRCPRETYLTHVFNWPIKKKINPLQLWKTNLVTILTILRVLFCCRIRFLVCKEYS